MKAPDALCASIGMRTCESCARNVEQYPGATPARLIVPASRPPTQCADWRALPHGFRRGATTQGALA